MRYLQNKWDSHICRIEVYTTVGKRNYFTRLIPYFTTSKEWRVIYIKRCPFTYWIFIGILGCPHPCMLSLCNCYCFGWTILQLQFESKLFIPKCGGKIFPLLKLLCYSWPRCGSLTFVAIIEPPGTSFDWYVLGACGSTSGLARMA